MGKSKIMTITISCVLGVYVLAIPPKIVFRQIQRNNYQ